jgi:hypothetical protein
MKTALLFLLLPSILLAHKNSSGYHSHAPRGRDEAKPAWVSAFENQSSSIVHDWTHCKEFTQLAYRCWSENGHPGTGHVVYLEPASGEPFKWGHVIFINDIPGQRWLWCVNDKWAYTIAPDEPIERAWNFDYGPRGQGELGNYQPQNLRKGKYQGTRTHPRSIIAIKGKQRSYWCTSGIEEVWPPEEWPAYVPCKPRVKPMAPGVATNPGIVPADGDGREGE